MGFFSKLFGGSSNKPAKEVQPIEYNGFLIYPDSIRENGQYRVAGKITKNFSDEVKSHQFIRSDVVASEQDANDLMVTKAQMLIDQMGERIF